MSRCSMKIRCSRQPGAGRIAGRPSGPPSPKIATKQFEKARAIISRKVPGASVEDVLNELVDHYLKSKAPRHKTRLKNARKPETRTRHIPNATRSEVMLRDHEQCTFVGEDGHRCTAKHNLHIDHIKPWAIGGTHDPANLRVLCAESQSVRSQDSIRWPAGPEIRRGPSED